MNLKDAHAGLYELIDSNAFGEQKFVFKDINGNIHKIEYSNNMDDLHIWHNGVELSEINVRHIKIKEVEYIKPNLFVGGYKVLFLGDVIRIGCIEISKQQIEEIYETFKKSQIKY